MKPAYTLYVPIHTREKGGKKKEPSQVAIGNVSGSLTKMYQ